MICLAYAAWGTEISLSSHFVTWDSVLGNCLQVVLDLSFTWWTWGIGPLQETVHISCPEDFYLKRFSTSKQLDMLLPHEKSTLVGDAEVLPCGGTAGEEPITCPRIIFSPLSWRDVHLHFPSCLRVGTMVCGLQVTAGVAWTRLTSSPQHRRMVDLTILERCRGSRTSGSSMAEG